jgi:hypothetical protein
MIVRAVLIMLVRDLRLVLSPFYGTQENTSGVARPPGCDG